MNLYRSFGSLLETWVTKGEPPNHSSEPLYGVELQEQCTGVDSGAHLTSLGATPMSKSVLGTMVESGMEDSGEGMASCNPSLTCVPHALSLGKTNMAPDSTAADGDNADLPLSSPRSPVFSLTSSSSSSSLLRGPSAGSQRQRATHRKVEQALRRADSGLRRQVLRPRWQWHSASFPAAQTAVHTQRAGNRSASVRLNRSFSLSVVDEQAPLEMLCRRDPSSHHNSLPGLKDAEVRREDVCEEGKEVLSPGLGYLEQVCRMLEEIARLQMYNQELQVEMESLQEQQISKGSECHGLHCKAAKRCDGSASKRFEVQDYKDLPCQSHNNNVHQDFRRRSASDTRLLMRDLSKVKRIPEGQYLSVDDLYEQPNDDKEQEKKEAVKKKAENKPKSWRVRIGSLRREETTGKISQQIQPSTKKATGYRLKNLFWRRKTVPLFEKNDLPTDSHS